MHSLCSTLFYLQSLRRLRWSSQRWVYGRHFLFGFRTPSGMGLRLALGAQRLDIIRLVVGKGNPSRDDRTRDGLGLSLVLLRLMSNLLYGVGASDPITCRSLRVLWQSDSWPVFTSAPRQRRSSDGGVAARVEYGRFHTINGGAAGLLGSSSFVLGG